MGCVFKFDVQDDVQVDVVNLILLQCVGVIVVQVGLVMVNGCWCEVDFFLFELKVVLGVYVIGDVIQIVLLMFKLGYMVNQYGKVVVVVVVVMLVGYVFDVLLLYINICYSFVMFDEVMYVVIVYCYDVVEYIMVMVFGVGGLFDVFLVIEGKLVQGWSCVIWLDMLGQGR